MKINNPDYRNSPERLQYLRDLMVDAADAKAIGKYSRLFVASAIDALLVAAEEHKSLEQAADDYRMALKFEELLVAAIKKAEAKEDEYARLRGAKK